jgi:hypothetical protein
VPYVVGPFSDAELGGFEPPVGHVGSALDLSPDVSAFLHQDAVPTDWRPTGLFYFPDVQRAQEVGRDPTYRILSGGGDTLDAASRDLFGRLAGYTPATSETAAEVLSIAVDDMAIGDDSAIDRQKVFGPTGGHLVIRVGNRAIIDRPISQRHRAEWMRCKRLDLLTAARHGGQSLAAACREVGYLLRQWSDSVESDWISAEAASIGLVPAVPATIYTDDFNRSSLGGDWTNYNFAVTVRTDNGGEVAMESQNGTATNVSLLRYDTDLSSTDHATKVTCVMPSVEGMAGPMCRFSVSAKTSYVLRVRSSLDELRIDKVVNNVYTSISAPSVSVSGLTKEALLDVSGSSLSGSWDGVEEATGTDSTISGNYRGGVLTHFKFPSGQTWVRDFATSDEGFPISEPENNILAARHHYNISKR